MKYFTTEKEAVAHALHQIKSNEHANRNYIGMYKCDKKVEEIVSELKKRGVAYVTDKIPYGGPQDWRTRIFVLGCGIKKVQDLIQKE